MFTTKSATGEKLAAQITVSVTESFKRRYEAYMQKIGETRADHVREMMEKELSKFEDSRR